MLSLFFNVFSTNKTILIKPFILIIMMLLALYSVHLFPFFFIHTMIISIHPTLVTKKSVIAFTSKKIKNKNVKVLKNDSDNDVTYVCSMSCLLITVQWQLFHDTVIFSIGIAYLNSSLQTHLCYLLSINFWYHALWQCLGCCILYMYR